MRHRAPGIQQHRLPAFVGRDRERVFLREELHAAISGRGQLVLVGGEAGIGKTTLVRDLLRDSDAEQALKLTGQCFDLTNTPPYGPWLDLFANYVPRDDLPAPPASFAGGRLHEISDQAQLHADLRDFLKSLSATMPVLLILEDLHWADPASLELLRHVSSRISDLRLLLLLTYRVDELTRSNPFYRQLPALIRESQGLRLDLRGLSPDELGMLVRSHWQVSIADEARLVDYLTRHADGNPFYVTELLRGLEESGHIDSTDSGRVVPELDQLVVPSLLRQAIEYRVERLGGDAHAQLAVASVIGQDIPLDLWKEVAGIDDDVALDLIDRAVQLNVLEAGRSGTFVTFVHALTREALYEGILPPRRRGWHQCIAETLIARDGSDPDVIAYHLVQAGDARAPEWLTVAGERAQRAYAWLTAQERFAEAAALLDGVAGAEQTRGWLLYRLARLHRYSGGSSVIEAFEGAERLGIQTGDALLATDSVYSRGVFLCFAGDFERGLDELVRGVDQMEAQLEIITKSNAERIPWMADSLPAVRLIDLEGSDPAIDVLKHHGVHHRRGGFPWFLALAGRFAEAEKEASTFITIATSAPSMGNWVRSATGHAHQGLAIAAANMGRPEKAHAAFELGRQIYTPLDHHAVVGFSFLAELRDCALPFETDNVALRRGLAAAAAAALERSGGTFPAGLSPDRAWLSVHFLEGNWAMARAIADDVPVHGTVLMRQEVTTSMAAIARAQGHDEEAWAFVHQALPAGIDTVPGATCFRETTVLQLIAADLSLDAGNLAGAHKWLLAHLRWMDWSGAVLGRAEGLAGWGRYFQAAGDEEGAMRSVREALAASNEPSQPLVRIAALRLLGDLERGADMFDEAALHLKAALELAIVCALPYEEALSRASLAQLFHETNEISAMLDEIRSSREIAVRLVAQPLLQRLAGIATPGAEEKGPIPGGLTPRELEVLRLVAKGMTDAAVGEVLFISPRTVGQHLRSIYGKLNVSSRSSATRFAIENGLD